MPPGSNPLNGSLFPEFLQAKEVNGGSSAGSERGIRQEVLNVLMAQLLQERGIVAAPEQILKDPFGRRRMPDVLVDFQGLRLVIEGEFDSSAAKDKASHAGLRRVEEGIAHIAMALIYPAALRQLGSNLAQLKDALEKADLGFAVITETESIQAQLSFSELEETKKDLVSFSRGQMGELVDALRSAYQLLLEDRVLERAIETLNNGIGEFLSLLKPQAATTARFSDALELRELPKAKATAGDGEEG